MWLDLRHTPIVVPCKLKARWFGPFLVMEVQDAQATLDLPSTFDKAPRKVNIHGLNFFDERDARFGSFNMPPQKKMWRELQFFLKRQRVGEAVCVQKSHFF